MIGAVYDKTETEVQNDRVLDLILDDMKENYIPGLRLGKNNHEYIKITPDMILLKQEKYIAYYLINVKLILNNHLISILLYEEICYITT